MKRKANRKFATFSLAAIGVLAMAIVIGLGSFDKAWVAQDDSGLFYFYQGQRILLDLSNEYVAIRPNEANGLNRMSTRYPEIASIAPGDKNLPRNLTLVKLKSGLNPSDVKQVYSKLRTDATIGLVAPVFRSQGGLMVVADEFIVQFSPAMTDKDVKSLIGANSVEVTQKVEWAENTYILRVLSGDALKAANLYAVTPGVIYSHPNFIRVMDNPRKTLPNPQEKKIYGPDGLLLPGDTQLPKGTGAYRVVGNSSKARPSSPVAANLLGVVGVTPDTSVVKTTIKYETFDSGFPGTEWQLYGDPTWAADTYRAYQGSSSAYCVGSSVDPPGPYPDNADSWMIYGPFSLAEAQLAQLNLMAWVQTESDYDFFYVLASVDGNWFYGQQISGDWATANSGSGGWMNITLDLSHVYTLGNLCGQQQVWIALVFQSDDSFAYEGVYVDDLKIEEITGGFDTLTTDQFSYLQWGLSNNGQSFGDSGVDVAIADAWAASQGSNQITIAIIDEGVDLTHPDLAGKLVTGYDATGGGSGGGPSGNDAHGTNCAGIAAAITDNSLGVAGAARLAKIMPVRIAYSGSDGNWVTNDSWIADGINWAVTNGADVLSDSWGGGSPSDAITNAITNAKTNGRGGKGCFVVFAAGNENGDAIQYPATLTNVISAGALSPCNERKSPISCDGEYWWGSSYGARLDLMAPGVHTYSTDIQGAAGYDPGDYFYNFNGTSSATAFVAGVAGLTLGACPSFTAAQLETILRQSAVDIGAAGWDEQTGYGRVNADAAVLAALAQCGITIEPNLVADFSGSGLWFYKTGIWSQISYGNVENMVYSDDVTALYGDFGAGGLWQWNGSVWNNLSWANPENMVASGSVLYVDFGSDGLWKWNGSVWSNLSWGNPESMVASGSVLYVDFEDGGLWQWNGSVWSNLSWGNPENMVASGSVLYVDFGAGGLWQWNGSTWSNLSWGDPENMVVSGSALYVDFGSDGLWQWNGSAWSNLSWGNPENMVASDSGLYVDFGAGGLWQWNGSAWSNLSWGNPGNMVVSGSTLYVSFADGGLWKWDGSTWIHLSDASPDKMVTAGF